PPELVERLAKVFRDNDGNLKETARALVIADEAWAGEQSKLKRPGEWVVAMVRAAGARSAPERFVRGQALLGEPMWRPSAPKGFPTTRRTGSMASVSGSTSPTISLSASPSGPTRARSSIPRSDRSRRPKPGRQSPAPRAVSRR